MPFGKFDFASESMRSILNAALLLGIIATALKIVLFLLPQSTKQRLQKRAENLTLKAIGFEPFKSYEHLRSYETILPLAGLAYLASWFMASSMQVPQNPSTESAMLSVFTPPSFVSLAFDICVFVILFRYLSNSHSRGNFRNRLISIFLVFVTPILGCIAILRNRPFPAVSPEQWDAAGVFGEMLLMPFGILIVLGAAFQTAQWLLRTLRGPLFRIGRGSSVTATAILFGTTSVLALVRLALTSN